MTPLALNATAPEALGRSGSDPWLGGQRSGLLSTMVVAARVSQEVNKPVISAYFWPHLSETPTHSRIVGALQRWMP